MRPQVKTWVLYGTLFSALGFSLSGNDPRNLLRTEGSAHLSAELPSKDGKDAKGFLKNAPSAGAGSSADAAAKAAEVKALATGNAAATATPSGEGREAVNRKPVGPKFETYTIAMKETGTTYQVVIVKEMKDGKLTTEAVYYPKAEGSDCLKCGLNNAKPVKLPHGFQGTAEEILAKVQWVQIPEDQKSNAIASNAETASPKKEDKSGEEILEGIIDRHCKSHGPRTELKCKAEKFVSVLKDVTKKAKAKKQKKGEKEELQITDEAAASYFENKLKEYFVDALTHKFDVGAGDLNGLTYLSDIVGEKQTALREKNEAKNLIRQLLRDIDGDYKETRNGVKDLYKLALEKQAEEVTNNILGMRTARDTKNTRDLFSNWGSFQENYRFLGLLNGDLFRSMNDDLAFGKRGGLITGSDFDSMFKEINDERKSILSRFFENDNLLSLSSHPRLENVTNNGRMGIYRGNIAPTGISATTLGAIRGKDDAEKLRLLNGIRRGM